VSRERILIELARVDDAWAGHVTELDEPDVIVGQRYDGSGPADVLEQIGQDLDVREVQRITSERGL